MIQLHLLGSIDLRTGDGAPVELALRSSKRVAVLAYLAAARPRGYHRRDKLVALFWPDLPEARARGALRTTLARLRDDLQADVFVLRGKNEIAIDETKLQCDVCQLEAAVDAGRAEDAADAYQGDFFDGVHIEGAADEFELWISSERARIRLRLLDALVSQSNRAEAEGQMATAVRIARRACALAPSDETVAQQLIRVLIATGDHGGALLALDDLTERMRREFEVEPSETTRELVRPLRERRTAPAVAAGERVLPAVPSSREQGPLDPQGNADPSRARRKLPLTMIAAAVLTLIAIGGASKSIAGRAGAPDDTAAPGVRHWESLNDRIDNPPPPRVFESAFLDSTRNALVLIGGLEVRGESAALSRVFGDVWRLSGLQPDEVRRWSELHPVPGPAPAHRWNALSAYDGSHDRALLHAGALGHSSPCVNDTWLLEHASGIGAAPHWRQVSTTGVRPSPRAESRGFLDTRSLRLVEFAGNDCVSTFMNDLWVLAFDDSSLASGRWIRLEPDSSAGAPSPRSATAAAYDARARRMWVHGGSAGGALSELWRLDHADASDGRPVWSPVHCQGAAPALSSHLAAYDSLAGTLILFGGIDESGASRNDVWVVSGLADGGAHCRWEHLPRSDDAPIRRQTARGFLIPDRGSLIVLGGEIEQIAFLDLWRLDRSSPREDGSSMR